ncbi:hypothetical protein SOCE26_029120 [Sorangium cellulosum]|uniref:Uncharacterized protein n=1 Tax=Sorangium cellulosum TaxID=56 RepID=A0A2L0EQB2_SORCE|nr:hypothetical protein [Sorangium cellulosum]AUX41498.1 hypothetical protein SOCE26_029120 [Sorangium cellulosum]
MTAHLTWTKGGEAELVEIDGDRVRLRSTTSSAPGARVEGALRSTGTAIRLKVARCRRCDGPSAPSEATPAERIYEVEGRLIDATREVRAELARLVDGERPH